MSKTNELERLIQSTLNGILTSYQEPAPASAVYPYAVWALRGIDLDDLRRDDILLEVSVWHRAGSDTQSAANDMADAIEAALGGVNLPQEGILPTIYRSQRKALLDEDKTLRRILIEFNIQSYTR